jgi:hypothetical protein
MGPRIYPSYQDTNTNAKGSLLFTMENSIDYIDIYVNNILVNKRYSVIEGLYSMNLNINDSVRLESVNPFTYALIRRDYTTDETNGDNGIIDTLISADSLVTSYTFTVSTITNAYNFEYIFDTTGQFNYKIMTEASVFILTENNDYINQQY